MKMKKSFRITSQTKIYLCAIVVLLAWLFYLVWKIGVDLTYNIADLPYHLAVSNGFAKAGGIVTWDFWESSPLGRAHNYPPLFHLIFANFLKTGLSPITTAKLMMEFTLVGGLAVYCWGVTKLFNLKFAFISTFLVATSFLFVRNAVTFMPATFTLFLAPVLFYALLKKRWISYIALLILMLYLHLFMPLLILFGIFLYLIIFDREFFWQWAKATAIALIAYSPWLLHVLLGGFDYIKYFDASYSTMEWIRWPTINIFIYFLGAIGLFFLFKKLDKQDKPAKLFLIMFFVFLGVALLSSNRIANGNLLLVASLFAASVINCSKQSSLLVKVFYIFILVSCAINTLYITMNGKHPVINLSKSSIVATVHPDTQTIFAQDDYNRIGRIIRENTTKNDTIISMVSLYGVEEYDRYAQVSIANYWAVNSDLVTMNMRQPELFHRPLLDPSKTKIFMTPVPVTDIDSNMLNYYNMLSDPKTLSYLQNNFTLLSSTQSPAQQRVYFYLNNDSNAVKGTIPRPKVPLWVADVCVIALISVVLLGLKNSKTKDKCCVSD